MKQGSLFNEEVREEAASSKAVYKIQKYKTMMVKDGKHSSPVNRVVEPKGAAEALRDYLQYEDKENFVILLLDIKNRIRGISTISVGNINSAIVSPRNIFQVALAAGNVASIILGHNHPSGDPTPSGEDIKVTKRLVDCGELLGLKVIDHVIIGEEGNYISFREKGLI